MNKPFPLILFLLLFSCSQFQKSEHRIDEQQEFKDFDKAFFSKTDKKETVKTRKRKLSKTLNRVKKEKKEPRKTKNTKRQFENPYRYQEKLHYKVEYNGLSVGELKIKFRGLKSTNDRTAYEFEGRFKTVGAFSYIYKVNSEALLYFDQEYLRPLASIIRREESDLKKEERTLYDWDRLKAERWVKGIEDDKEIDEHKTFDIINNTQDILSFLVYLRTISYKFGEKYSIPFFHKGEMFQASVRVVENNVYDFSKKLTLLEIELPLKGKLQPSRATKVWLIDNQYKDIFKIDMNIKLGRIIIALDD